MVSKPEFHLPDRPTLTAYRSLGKALGDAGLGELTPALERLIREGFAPDRHGKLDGWLQAVAELPDVASSYSSLHRQRQALYRQPQALQGDAICVGGPGDLNDDQRTRLRGCLHQLMPWRKGPFEIFGIRVDAEWRSDLKWRRVADAISPLAGRTVLDVGASNGYYAWRMAGAGARLVLGVDPSLNYVLQYLALARYLPQVPAYVIPCRLEDLPSSATGFDSVFSMGVLYHQRAPLEHLSELHRRLRPGGELVLETLVVPEGCATLHPSGRYARMRNVRMVPASAELRTWLAQTGFADVRLASVTPTTSEEQRRTQWMPFESLAQALDPQDPTTTVEGHPAPRRALLIARR